ncbi:hypothetical protein AO353_26070 [Pseudomonas fluorescens]|uniref:Uncharacterized protein n=1 Tax=Pseudomonas fluorescens TaxID=294 RepID=A0A0N9WQP9_PSEFL|nr:hypothetical protein AO353_26070 [Pseudomonas fluorescens]
MFYSFRTVLGAILGPELFKIHVKCLIKRITGICNHPKQDNDMMTLLTLRQLYFMLNFRFQFGGMLVERNLSIKIIMEGFWFKLSTTNTFLRIPAILGNKPAVTPSHMRHGVYPFDMKRLAWNDIQQWPSKWAI